MNAFFERRRSCHELDGLLYGVRAGCLECVADDLVEIDQPDVEIDATGRAAREVEEVGDEPGLRMRAEVNRLERLPARRLVVDVLAQHLLPEQECRERRPQLV